MSIIALSAFAVPQPVKDIPAGALGIWQIPELDISIPVYAGSSVGKTVQQVIDDPHSAAWERWGKAYGIGDHYNSEAGKSFWRVERIRPCMLAFFHRKDGIYKYECYSTHVADVKSYGWIVNNNIILPHSSKDIVCSCCVGGDSKRNYLACFRLKGKEKNV